MPWRGNADSPSSGELQATNRSHVSESFQDSILVFKESSDHKPIILYVEDNYDNLILVQRVLEAEGFGFIGVDNAVSGLDAAREFEPDLILLDINMPFIDGLTLASKLKSDPDLNMIPLIALTANVMRGDRDRSISAGCDGYIQKPIDVDILPKQIARFLHPI
jgi:two-component system cell cycle response regulator DivK